MPLYEVENVNNENICTIVINRKEYFEKFRSKSINKKHKVVQKDTKWICFDVYVNRITDFNQKAELKKKKMNQKKFLLRNGEMEMTTVNNKVLFASLNDKQYYCPHGMKSLLCSPLLLLEVRKKRKHFQKFKK